MPKIPKYSLTILLIITIVVMIFLLVKSNLIEGVSPDYVDAERKYEELILETKRKREKMILEILEYQKKSGRLVYTTFQCGMLSEDGKPSTNRTKRGSRQQQITQPPQGNSGQQCTKREYEVMWENEEKESRIRLERETDRQLAALLNFFQTNAYVPPQQPSPKNDCVDDNSKSWKKRGGSRLRTCTYLATLKKNFQKKWCNYMTTQKRGGRQYIKDICPKTCGNC